MYLYDKKVALILVNVLMTCSHQHVNAFHVPSHVGVTATIQPIRQTSNTITTGSFATTPVSKKGHDRAYFKNQPLYASASTTSSSPSENNKGLPSVVTSVASTFAFIFLDILFKKIFKALNITSFPAPLGGCGIIFTAMLALYSIKSDLGDGLYGLLSPGSDVLAKWLPVFFVPSLGEFN